MEFLKIQNDWIKLKEFFIHIFLFIYKTNVESITMWNLTQNEYLTLMVGVWIVILFLTWFFLWMVFKIVSYFK
uniref:Plectrovirus spv1-r8a2b orf 10 transmembrane protein n=1 Tax=Spiroplasma citri TaxID=2133 RepID=Q14LM0_SPICI|nr:plectrovirus spv1-r8a2b orf 10 transmembrane protein [Spiroplasma citri]